MSKVYIQSQFNEPIVFRTAPKEIYNKTYKEGSIWLRSAQYYRDMEDKIRNDSAEGMNGGKTIIPLHLKHPSGFSMSIQGEGQIGHLLDPHYVMSLHGTSISAREHKKFGGCTLGIKSIFSLVIEIVFKVSQKIPVVAYRYGPISYQYTSLTISNNSNGTAICIGENPSLFLKSVDSNVLRKDPVQPFIEQDEWRIAVFTDGYYKDDSNEPLDLIVDRGNFYEYIQPSV